MRFWIPLLALFIAFFPSAKAQDFSCSRTIKISLTTNSKGTRLPGMRCKGKLTQPFRGEIADFHPRTKYVRVYVSKGSKKETVWEGRPFVGARFPVRLPTSAFARPGKPCSVADSCVGQKVTFRLYYR